jgi:pyridoxal phosphate enzyme (YggS family)
VALLAVSKTQGPQAVRHAYAAGQTAFGENYVQEALDKMRALADLPLQWHCIGPVQSNKARLVAAHFDWVHSVDRLKLAERLSVCRPVHLPPLQVCLQINIDAAPTKTGASPEDAVALALAVAALPHLCLRGIMTIPEPATDFAGQHAVHQRARTVFDQIQRGLAGVRPNAAAGFDTLSMGMSADLAAAIAAGSTVVRVGTAIFGPRPAPA